MRLTLCTCQLLVPEEEEEERQRGKEEEEQLDRVRLTSVRQEHARWLPWERRELCGRTQQQVQREYWRRRRRREEAETWERHER